MNQDCRSVSKTARRESLLSSKSQRGFNLIEMMVTVVILSILASVAIPYAELSVRRSHEYELKSTIRDIRSAIDRFHLDWQAQQIVSSPSLVSDDGYPRTLAVLVNGIDEKGAMNKKRYYLRRIPKNPFVDPNLPVEEHWQLRGYQDAPDALYWGERDVYDVRPNTDRIAIDGTPYKSW